MQKSAACSDQIRRRELVDELQAKRAAIAVVRRVAALTIGTKRRRANDSSSRIGHSRRMGCAESGKNEPVQHQHIGDGDCNDRFVSQADHDATIMTLQAISKRHFAAALSLITIYL